MCQSTHTQIYTSNRHKIISYLSHTSLSFFIWAAWQSRAMSLSFWVVWKRPYLQNKQYFFKACVVYHMWWLCACGTSNRWAFLVSVSIWNCDFLRLRCFCICSSLNCSVWSLCTGSSAPLHTRKHKYKKMDLTWLTIFFKPETQIVLSSLWLL